MSIRVQLEMRSIYLYLYYYYYKRKMVVVVVACLLASLLGNFRQSNNFN